MLYFLPFVIVRFVRQIHLTSSDNFPDNYRPNSLMGDDIDTFCEKIRIPLKLTFKEIRVLKTKIQGAEQQLTSKLEYIKIPMESMEIIEIMKNCLQGIENASKEQLRIVNEVLESSQKLYKKLKLESNSNGNNANQNASLRTAFLPITHQENILCHEVRNALHGTTGAIELLKNKVKIAEDIILRAGPFLDSYNTQNLFLTLEEIKKYLSLIEICSEHQEALITATLSAFSQQDDKIVPSQNIFNLKKIMQTIIQMFQAQLEYKNIRLTLELPIEEKYLKTDRRILMQIMVNLLSNSIKFTPIGGNITVKATSEPLSTTEEKWTISVRDSGIGMTSQEINKLFTPFTQANSQILSQYGGTGLGLSIIKTLIENLNGTIQIKSEKGKGSEFFFSIPCSSLSLHEQLGNSLSLSTMENSPLTTNEITSKQVLVVDDNIINQMVLGAFLKREGYQYEIASNGKEALEKYQKFNFDIILTDLQMPEMDGRTATREIRKLEESSNRHALIIGLSANSHPEDIQEGLNSGMDAYLPKPYKPEDLFSLMKGHRSLPHAKPIATPLTEISNLSKKDPAPFTPYNAFKNNTWPLTSIKNLFQQLNLKLT